MKIREKLNQLKTKFGLEPKPLPKVKNKPIKKEEVVPPDQTLEEPTVVDNMPPEPEIITEPMDEIIPTDSEKDDMQAEVDEGYLQYSSEVVGFENRELQIAPYYHILIVTIF